MRFWKKRLQRVAAMVCSVALLASMMPTAAFAEGPTPTPTASVENATPTPSPDPAASAEPTVSPEPTVEPTQAPEGTAVPTAQPTPTPEGTAVPAESAASDAESTVEPSAEPTAQPTEQPAEEAAPSEQPQSDATAPESSANSDVETYGGWHDWDDDWWEDHFPDWGEDWDKGYYVWNVANITRKHNGGYELERVYHDDVNNPDHVSVYVSDQENTRFADFIITKGQAHTAVFIIRAFVCVIHVKGIGFSCIDTNKKCLCRIAFLAGGAALGRVRNVLYQILHIPAVFTEYQIMADSLGYLVILVLGGGGKVGCYHI